MKITQVSAFFKPREGGSQNYCYQLSKHLAERGHEVEVITSQLYKNSPTYEIMDGFKVHRCPNLGIIWGTNPATPVIHKLLKCDTDLIHAHSYTFMTTNQSALARKLRRTPLLIHLHGGLETFPTQDLFTRIKLTTIKNIYDQTIGKWTLETGDLIASVSKRDIDLAKKRWNINTNKLCWIPNAVNLNNFNKNNDEDNLNVVFIGRLEDWKGIKVFIEVIGYIIKEREDICFTIVGEGSLKEYVKNNIHNKRVKILGQIPHEMIPNILSSASVLVLPSYSEGMPTVCLEAFASEVPVVASNVGGIPELVIEGETGYLFPPGNAHLCAEKVIRLLSDTTLRNKMGKRGRTYVEQLYTWEKIVKKVEKVYDKIGGD